jgi:bifunctional non-homologous end joining protein LigD
MAAARKPKSARASGTDRPLAHYQSMRDFSVTAEPQGAKSKPPAAGAAKALPFVVQKHAATRLHYDFRLGLDGVLKSWAVTKGPSYYPGDKRLAVQVEDHPWEYAGFEGTIPKGQYGGGTVMVWDEGEWIPHGDAEQGLIDGELKFELRGKKLKGNWVLVRMHGQAGGSNKTNWLLIKERDKFARESSAPAITDEAPDSAVSGQTMDEIAESSDRVWNSARGTEKGPGSTTHEKKSGSKKSGPASLSAPPERKRKLRAPDLKNIPRERFPGFIAPQLAQQTASASQGEGWLHELKLDGYRIQILIRSDDKKAATNRAAKLLTRKGLDWTARMPDIAAAAARLNVESAILDGEAVALDDRGVSSFADLQAAFHEGRQQYITYFAFDLLHLNGHNLRGQPLEDRKRILEGLLRDAGDKSPLKLSEDIEADGNEVFEKACALGAEGIVSKHKSAKYTSGRSGAWLKLKCRLEQEFVIGGFTLPSKGGSGIGALLLGYYEKGKLRYVGRAGTGFTQKTHQIIRARLDRLQQKNSPFADVPREERRSAIWVKPELVAEVAFATWTHDNLVRQAAFKGLREDKPAREVVRETAVGQSAAERSSPVPKSAKSGGRGRGKEATATKELAITHPDKVLDPESGTTKQQLAEYYMAVAEHMLPHIAYRPISVLRCPDGVGKSCFFQKHVGMGLPAGVKTVAISNRKSKEQEAYLTVDSSEGLLGLAQMGVLEIHPWGSRNESLDTPDRIVFDLDPDAAIGWKTLTETALELKARLKKVGLESFVKSTGGKGLHVVAPIRPDHEWPAVKDFAHRMALELEREKPELYVTKMTKAVRKNRIYLDYLRNDREATSVAPYSPRARTGMPVAVPLAWKELDSAKAPAFHVSDFAKWRTRLRRDPWQKMLESKQKLKL